MSEREIIAKQAEVIAQQAEVITWQAEQIRVLTKTVEELQAIIKQLRRQLGENSQNSSKPPSSDGYRKLIPKSQRKKTGKKPGGQEGRSGSHMEIPHEPDEIKQHLPEKCQMCQNLSKCLADGKVFQCGEKRYVVECASQDKSNGTPEHTSQHLSKGQNCAGRNVSGERESVCAVWGLGDCTGGAVKYLWCH